MTPGRWPVPDVFIGLGGSADVFRSQSEPPQLSPVKPPSKAEPLITPTDARKKNGVFARRSGRRSGSVSSFSQTPLTHRRSKIRTSREERLRISRIREQKALDGFRMMMSSSQTPSPHGDRAASRPRQLPETPSRASKAPLGDYFHESRGLKSTLSKRSVKTLRSAKSVRSVRSAWADDDDEDAWEDIRPPESVIGEWDGIGSDGSFPVYI